MMHDNIICLSTKNKSVYLLRFRHKNIYVQGNIMVWVDKGTLLRFDEPRWNDKSFQVKGQGTVVKGTVSDSWFETGNKQQPCVIAQQFVDHPSPRISSLWELNFSLVLSTGFFALLHRRSRDVILLVAGGRCHLFSYTKFLSCCFCWQVSPVWRVVEQSNVLIWGWLRSYLHHFMATSGIRNQACASNSSTDWEIEKLW